MGTIMIISDSVFLLSANDMAGAISQDKVGLLLLQAVIFIKFISASVVVMPAGINLKQVMAGYAVADLIFCFPLFWNKPLFFFSGAMVFAQVVLLMIYAIAERRAPAKAVAEHEWKTANNLIFQVQ
jgi:hypothetical protein